jgi:glycosyltransferase involved in cell wall biosynthesis
MPIRLLVIANWNLDQQPTTWAIQRIRALEAAGVSVELLWRDCIQDPRGYLRLWRALDERLKRGDVDLVAPLYGSFLGLLCTLQRRVPCALSFAGSDLNGRVTPGRITLHSLCRPASQLSTVLAAGVSVCNPDMADSLWWPPARRQAQVIPDGVDTLRFRPLPRDEARRIRKLPAEGARVVFVATQAASRPYKRLSLAQAAVARLPGVVLEVVEAVPFDEMPAAYAAADALLLTSLDEGSPNCVKEALACGVPVVSVDVGDVRQMISGLRNCVIAPATPEALASALKAVIADGRRCPEGPARIARDYSLDAVTGKFLQFFEAVLSRDSTKRGIPVFAENHEIDDSAQKPGSVSEMISGEYGRQ